MAGNPEEVERDGDHLGSRETYSRHFVGQYTERPPVHCFVVSFRKDDFRRQIFYGEREREVIGRMFEARVVEGCDLPGVPHRVQVRPIKDAKQTD